MPLAKVSTKRQITIPVKVFDELGLDVGDLLEVTVENGKGVLVPQKLTAKTSVPKLSKAEQATLKKAQAKIQAINNTPLDSMGLNKAEIAVAAKVGIIDKDQAWFWTEEWQKGLREAERDIQNGDTFGPFDNIKDALAALKSA
jgi:AbrB family looped-hinge helix DNA binding protein